MSISGWLKSNVNKYDQKEALITAGIKELRCKRESILGAYRKTISTNPQKRTVGFSESEIRAKHDNMFKIREGVKQLDEGRYLTDQQMREFCQVNPSVWRGYSENLEFISYKIKVQGGTVYWGVPKCISKLKNDLNVT